MRPYDYRGKTALVTGASSGIGEAYAHALAARGANLVLVARSEPRLQALAAELTRAHGVRAEAVPADLVAPGAAADTYARATSLDLPPDVVVNNAGFATYGPLGELALGRERDEVLLNCLAVLEMTRAALPRMVAQAEGVVVNVASTAAFQPDPYMATYGATKAFVLSFTEAVAAETRRHGVRTLALCPGATETPFFDVLRAEEASVGRRMSPEAVVEAAFHAVDRGRNHVVPGVANRVLATLPRLLPRGVALAVTERVLRPRSAPENQGVPTSETV